jgi:hypothetical protein
MTTSYFKKKIVRIILYFSLSMVFRVIFLNLQGIKSVKIVRSEEISQFQTGQKTPKMSLLGTGLTLRAMLL